MGTIPGTEPPSHLFVVVSWGFANILKTRFCLGRYMVGFRNALKLFLDLYSDYSAAASCFVLISEVFKTHMKTHES